MVVGAARRPVAGGVGESGVHAVSATYPDEAWKVAVRILHEVGGLAPHWADEVTAALMRELKIEVRDD